MGRIAVVTVRSKDGRETGETVNCFLMSFSSGIIWSEEGGGDGFEG